VVFVHQGRLFGAANACCPEAAALGEPVLVSPQRLDADASVKRWRDAWVPQVIVDRFPST
jgi:hypothetical protein